MQTRQELVGQELHDRATRGETLIDIEKTTLQAWYDAQDAVESTRLQVTPSLSTNTLRADVDAVLLRLQEATQYLQHISAENAILKSENATLTRRLARTTQEAA